MQSWPSASLADQRLSRKLKLHSSYGWNWRQQRSSFFVHLAFATCGEMFHVVAGSIDSLALSNTPTINIVTNAEPMTYDYVLHSSRQMIYIFN